MLAPVPRWITIATASVIAVFGVLNFAARNWLWGDAGYNVEARQPIMILGVVALVVGLAFVRVGFVGSADQLRLAAGTHAAIFVPMPAVVALNIGGWDRVYQATSVPLIYIAVGLALTTTAPTLYAYLSLARSHRDGRGGDALCNARTVTRLDVDRNHGHHRTRTQEPRDGN